MTYKYRPGRHCMQMFLYREKHIDRLECGLNADGLIVHRLPLSIPANKSRGFLQEKYIESPGQFAKNKRQPCGIH